MGRRLGQHFLTNPAILDRIVEALEPRPDDVVIEIGPGRGTLTSRLAPRVGHVIAIEKDPHLADVLRSTDVHRPTSNGQRNVPAALPDNVTVVQGDALGLRWADLLPDQPWHLGRWTLDVFKVIGNIPYYITTPLIEKALSPPLPQLVVFLVQKEVADRLAAAPGSKTYGALSAGVQAIAAVERLFVIKRGAFRPPPKVDSALVRFRPLHEPLVTDAEREAWRGFLARLFSQRRKQLGHSLRALSGWTREATEEALWVLGIDLAVRPELLPPQTLVRLFRAVVR